jgi:AraC-like DNA-binding protein
MNQVQEPLETDPVAMTPSPGALHIPPQALTVATKTLQLIRRTKTFLEAEFANRILLADVARAVGASPAHLTALFRRVEGIPLHRYLMHLRLQRALVLLPQADDLTKLALEVGFSSHSHFTAAFRRRYGVTPSKVRENSRYAQLDRGAGTPRVFTRDRGSAAGSTLPGRPAGC